MCKVTGKDVKSTQWWVYLVRCNDGCLYTGIATDVARRFKEHQELNGKGAKFLRGKGPLALMLEMPVGSRALASKVEIKIKKLRKAKKERLVKNPHLMEEIINRLNTKSEQES